MSYDFKEAVTLEAAFAAFWGADMYKWLSEKLHYRGVHYRKAYIRILAEQAATRELERRFAA
jgi:hypothetical protein